MDSGESEVFGDDDLEKLIGGDTITSFYDVSGRRNNVFVGNPMREGEVFGRTSGGAGWMAIKHDIFFGFTVDFPVCIGSVDYVCRSFDWFGIVVWRDFSVYGREDEIFSYNDLANLSACDWVASLDCGSIFKCDGLIGNPVRKLIS